MKTLAEKVKALLPMLEQRGTVYLFALFERRETAGKWDIILSSEWSDKDRSAAVWLISDSLISKLTPEELSALSRVFIAPSHEPEVENLALAEQGTPVKHFFSDDFSFMDVPIKQGYVFCARRTPRFDLAV
jgi:hypothetical protein